MVIGIILILVAIGTVAFHFLSPWWWTPIASNWGYIDTAIIITFWVTGAVFIGIIAFMAYCAVRYHHKRGKQAAYEPENKKLEIWLTVLTSVGVAVMLAPGLFVWNQFVTVPDDATEIEVLGQQWLWSFRLPGKDGKLGISDGKYVTGDNPFGLDPNDPNGRDDVLIVGEDLHLPIDKPVKVLLRSIDVLHDFYVPEFRAKMDLVPGAVTFYWFTPTRTGTYDTLCFELCGVGHHAMRGKVVVDEKSDYETWLNEQTTFAEYLAQSGSGGEDEDSTRLVSTEGETGSTKGDRAR